MFGNDGKLEGGCLCGSIRYEVPAAGRKALHCHCRICQRSAGAVAMSWVDVKQAAFRITKGDLKTFQSSSHGTRGFCGQCGTQIFYHGTPGGINDFGVTLASLDDPAAVQPEANIWMQSAVSGISLDRHLPSHSTETPEFKRKVQDGRRLDD